MGSLAFAGVFAGVLAGVLAGALAAASVAPLVQGGSIPSPWRVVTLPQQAAPVTRYSAETVDGREALRVQTQGSYGNLIHEPIFLS